MGRIMRVCCAVILALATQCVALPLFGDDAVMLQESGGGLLPKADDAATVEAEVNQAIQQDVNMGTAEKLGEAPKLGARASTWEKRAMAQINAMSASEIDKSRTAAPDKLSAKFAADVKQASKVLHQPVAKKTKKSMIRDEVAKALASPKQAQKLKQAARQAELDFANIPVALVQEQEEPNIGEDAEDDSLHLMDGSDSDVMKAINQQIGTMANDKLG